MLYMIALSLTAIWEAVKNIFVCGLRCVTDGMDASPYTGPAAGSFRRESSLEPDGIKVPKWK
ncbi:MAG: hypothetical protein ACYCUY_09745, partial [Acidithiobacillus sp.]